MRVLKKDEIDELLKNVVVDLDEKVKKRKTSKNKTVKLLQKIATDFEELADLSLKVKVDVYNSRSPEKLQALKENDHS